MYYNKLCFYAYIINQVFWVEVEIKSNLLLSVIGKVKGCHYNEFFFINKLQYGICK